MRKRINYPPLDMRRTRLAFIRGTDIPTFLEQRALVQKKLDVIDRQIAMVEAEAAQIEAELAKEELQSNG